MVRKEQKPSATSQLRAQARLERIRKRYDDLDCQISALLNERFKIAGELTSIKAQLGMAIKDRRREKAVLDRVARAGESDEISAAIRAVYEHLIEQSRNIQDKTIESPAPKYFPQITIYGVGLIGGALAKVIKHRIPNTKIIAVDSEQVLAEALGHNLIDKGVTDHKQALYRSSLVILAASPSQNLKLLEEIAPFLSKRKLVLDVSSTKGAIAQLAEQINLKGADFIGGHPLFGSEKSGISGALELNPEGTTFCIVPGAKSSEMSVRRLIRWLTLLNFRIETVDAFEHDVILARTSHVVQLLAVVLGSQITSGLSDAQLKKLGKLSGPSLLQLTRLMKSPPGMWREIIRLNKREIISALSEVQSGLDDLIVSLRNNQDDLDNLFAKAYRLSKAVETIQ